MDAPTDEQLLAEFVKGHNGSLELLVRRYARDLHQFAQRITGDSVAAEDVVQDTFLQVHGSAATFNPHRRFKPWLFTIAANKARDHLRRRVRRREIPLEAQLRSDEEIRKRFVDLLAAANTEPVYDLTLEERRRAVKDVVGEMPGKLREVLVLAYFYRFPYKDIGEILEIPLGTVKSRLHAAVVWFGERYQERITARSENGA